MPKQQRALIRQGITSVAAQAEHARTLLQPATKALTGGDADGMVGSPGTELEFAL